MSTAKQADDELPLESQIAQCTEKAADLGVRVDRVFVDAGRSGRDEDRPEFQEAIQFCETLSPEYFITWSTSRFSRDKVHAGMYKLRLAKAGTEIIYVSMPIDRHTNTGWMTEGMLELFDEFYSRQIAADTTRSMVKNAMEGYFNGGRAPFGFRAMPAPDNLKRKRLEPNPAEVPIVSDIFKMRARGAGAKTIAIHLQDQGVKNRNKEWTKSSILALLRNDTMVGRVVFGRRDRATRRIKPRSQWIIVDAHEPIISIDLWDSVQSLMDDATADSNKGSPKSTYLFTGILHDEATGTSMQIESAKGYSKRYWYYNCRAAQKLGTGQNRRIAAREFDEWMVGVILDRILTPDFLEVVISDLHDACGTWVLDHKKRRQVVASSLTAAGRKNSKIFEVLEEYGRDSPNLGDLTKRLRANNEHVNKLEAQLAAIDAEQKPDFEITPQYVDELAATLRYIIETTENPKKLRHFFGSFIDRIWVLDDSVRLEYRPECLIVGNQEPVTVPSKVGWLPEHALLGTKTLAVQMPARFHKRVA